MKKTPKHKLYSDAETMFTEHGSTCTEISETLGITEATLSKWRNQMRWDTMREEILSSPDKIRKILREELQWIAQGKKSRVDTDALSKVSKTLQYFDGKVALSVVIAVLKELDNYMAEIDPAKAVEFTEYHKIFIGHRAKLDSLK